MEGLFRKIPGHLFSSGFAKQPHAAANVGVKAAICQQKHGFCGSEHFGGKEHTLAVRGSLSPSNAADYFLVTRKNLLNIKVPFNGVVKVVIFPFSGHDCLLIA